MKNLCKLLLSPVLLALLLPTYVSASPKCYGLAFSSGDETVAYQVGALTGLINNLPADQVGYQVISGVQGGALNAALFSSFAIGQEKDAVNRMQEFWLEASNTTLYKDWRGGVTEGLMFKGGLYDSSPL